MIDSIRIAGVATYGVNPVALSGLSTFNFLFGSNGSGKTTITRVIADEGNFPSCGVTWKGGTRLQAMVYNRDFVAKNFNQSADLKGIFTLGQGNVETINRIASAKAELDTLTTKVETLTCGLRGDDGLGGKAGELATLDSQFRDKCWAQKQKHDAKLSGAFEGFRNNAEKFKAKVLLEQASNTTTLELLPDLERRAETVCGPTPMLEKSIAVVYTADIVACESDPILSKRVIGKEDVDIAEMIHALGNSDWVREGLSYFDANKRVCPFCQRTATDSFAKSLIDYFDEAFERDSSAIAKLEMNYKESSERIQQQVGSILAMPSKFLDVERLRAASALLDSTVTLDLQRLAAKKKEPSHAVDLESLADVASVIESLIAAANAQVANHNTMVTNLAQERRTLTSQVWKYLLEVELKADLTAYVTRRDGLTKAIAAMTAQVQSATTSKASKMAEIRALEKQTTSVQPTIDGINALLMSFGFSGFSLAQASKGPYYRLLRPDGTDAKETLSEGERSFVTFLYFYHLLKGSDSESGVTVDRVVVFDDPVSSLDSDIVFIVGSLIKGLFQEVRVGQGHVKQVFVFTHNVYFHKEVTFNKHRRDIALSDETFWVVRKSGLGSRLVRHTSNPIKTSYELLWAEVRRPDHSNLTIQNTLRRILENYFRIMGEVDTDKICALFDGKEKLVCRSLFSWVNAGSHDVHDDLYVSIDDSLVESYLQVFRAIFEKSNHLGHYRMMMGDAFDEVAADAKEA